MRRLFTENGTYSAWASEFEGRIISAIRPIVEEYINNGWDYRDVQLLTQNAAIDAALESILTMRDKLRGDSHAAPTLLSPRP